MEAARILYTQELEPKNSPQLFFEGGSYFDSLIDGIDHARRTIDLQTYIFEAAKNGGRVLDALVQASARGVQVRLLVDGFGSWSSIRKIESRIEGTSIQFRVYRPLLFDRHLGFKKLAWLGSRRNHRKTCVIDHESAWVGSLNICDSQWRDTAIRLTGTDLRVIVDAFDRSWSGDLIHKRVRAESHSPFWLNCTFRLRRERNRKLCQRIQNARRKVWITTPYFSPNRALRRALRHAAIRRVDVRLLLPHRPDVIGMRWINAAFYKRLSAFGVHTYLYEASMLHAKTVIVDDWALIGSSNLNQRSLLHDLEVDTICTNPALVSRLKTQFQHDLLFSRLYKKADFNHESFLTRWFDRFARSLQRWT